MAILAAEADYSRMLAVTCYQYLFFTVMKKQKIEIK
jgi:hypothetical protein